MNRTRRKTIEFRFYELPQSESVIGLAGEKWYGSYGNPERADELHFHNLFEFGYCRHGTGTMYFRDIPNRYREGMFTLIPAYYPHNTVSDGSNYWEYIFFDPIRLVRELFPANPGLQGENLGILNRQAKLYTVQEQETFISTAEQILTEVQERYTYRSEVIHHRTLIFLLELLRIREQEIPDSQWKAPSENLQMTQINPAIQHIESHYAENLHAEDLARQCGLSEVHFRRIFDEIMNLSPMEYLNLIRIQKACDLLVSTEESMDFIAVSCGFNSVSTFTRNFRRFLDTTPYQWKLNQDNYRADLLSSNITVKKGWQILDSLE